VETGAAAAYASFYFEVDSGTDTDASSDDGEEPADMPDVPQVTAEPASERAYWQYRKAKRRWRRFTGQPVRLFR
jgi:hypothetical protein